MESEFKQRTMSWEKFNAWRRSLLEDVRLSSDIRAYLSRRIEELVMQCYDDIGPQDSKEFWNTDPIALEFLWKWTDEDVACGAWKASELGH